MADCCLIKKVATVEVYENKNEVRAYGFMAGDRNTPVMEVRFKHLWGESNLSSCKLRWIIVDDVGSLLVGEVPIQSDNTALINLPNELFTGDRRMKVQLTVASCDGERILNLQQFTDLKVINSLATNEVVEPVYQILINQLYDETQKYLSQLDTLYTSQYGSLENLYVGARASLEQYLITAENGGNAEFLQGYAPHNFKKTEDTIANLKASTKYKLGDVVEVLGFHAKGDGSHHKRIAKSEDDGSGELGQDGIWWCIVHSGEVCLEWFGMKLNGSDEGLLFNKINELTNISCVKTKITKGSLATSVALMFVVNKSLDLNHATIKSIESANVVDLFNFVGTDTSYNQDSRKIFKNFTLEGREGESEHSENGIVFNPNTTSISNNLANMYFENVEFKKLNNAIIFGSRQYINHFLNCRFYRNNNCLLRDASINPITDSGENITFSFCTFANSKYFCTGYYDDMIFEQCSIDFIRNKYLSVKRGFFRFNSCRIEWGGATLESEEHLFEIRQSENVDHYVKLLFDKCFFLGGGLLKKEPFYFESDSNRNSLTVDITQCRVFNLCNNDYKVLKNETQQKRVLNVRDLVTTFTLTSNSGTPFFNNEKARVKLYTNVSDDPNLITNSKLIDDTASYFNIEKNSTENSDIYKITKKNIDRKSLFLVIDNVEDKVVCLNYRVRNNTNRNIFIAPFVFSAKEIFYKDNECLGLEVLEIGGRIASVTIPANTEKSNPNDVIARNNFKKLDKKYLAILLNGNANLPLEEEIVLEVECLSIL